MATTTPNFGWAVPTSTDLVKDGAVAIETLGDSIDASLVDLKGGTTGQVLAKASGTDMDFTWTTSSAGMTNPMTTTGDTIYSSSGSTPARLGIGSTGQVLTVASGIPSWATPASGTPTFSGCGLYQSSAQSISNTTQTDLTFVGEHFDTDGYHSDSVNTSRITIPTGKTGYFLVTARVAFASNSTGTRGLWIRVNGSETQFAAAQPVSTGDLTTVQISQIMALSAGNYITMNAYQASGGSLNTAIDQGKTAFAIQYLGA